MAKKPPDRLFEILRAGWTKEDHDAFKQELDGSSDRAAALIAAAYLEGSVEFILRRALVNAPSRGDEMLLFGTSGALSNFATKVRLCHLLNVFGKYTRDDILTIIGIRNKFAHSSRAITFRSSEIASLCAKLIAHHRYCSEGLAIPFQEGWDNVPNRVKYLSTCLDIDAILINASYAMLKRQRRSLKRAHAAITRAIDGGQSIDRITRKHLPIP